MLSRVLRAWYAPLLVGPLCGLVAAAVVAASPDAPRGGSVRGLAPWFLGVTVAVAVLGAAGRAWNARVLANRPTIVVEPDGFAVELRAGERLRVAWDAVARVVAYKRDLGTTDEIVLAFELADHPGRVLELSEEWPGFAGLFAPMERALGISAAWYTQIMTPAFAATPRVLLDRAHPSGLGAPAV